MHFCKWTPHLSNSNTLGWPSPRSKVHCASFSNCPDHSCLLLVDTYHHLHWVIISKSQMLQCLRDYLLRTCSLRILSELHSSDYQSTSEHTYSCLERIFTDTGDRRPLLEQFLLRMSHTNYWQVGLRYILVIFRVCRKRGLYTNKREANGAGIDSMR